MMLNANVTNNKNNFFSNFSLLKMKIALIGKMCSGKTTLSELLCKEYNMKRYSFADKLKEIAKDLFFMEKKDRKLLQDIGDKMKEIKSDVWIQYLVHNIKDKDNIVIDDVRFENEFKALEELGFIMIKINVDPKVQWERLKQKYGEEEAKEHKKRMNHISEKELDSFKTMSDIELESNNDTYENIKLIIDKLK